MENKYTAGPWEINDTFNELNDFYEGQDIIISRGNYPILAISTVVNNVGISEDQQELWQEFQANCELIARAPEMDAELTSLKDENKKLRDSIELLAQHILSDFIDDQWKRVSNTDIKMIHSRLVAALQPPTI